MTDISPEAVEARGCARGQGTTQFCAEAVSIARERDAALAEVARLREALTAVHRRVQNQSADRTFEDCVRDLMHADALCRAALAKEDVQ